MPKFSDYPQSAVNNAKRAIKHKEDNGSDCGTQVGWIRARQIANKEGFDEPMIKRIFSFLSRAKTYDQGKYVDEDGNEICGSIMYDAWGGDSMKTWAERKLNEIEKEENSKTMSNKEQRTYTGSIEIRMNDDGSESRTIEGYAAVFDTWSHDLGWFREKIDRSAFEGVDMSDVVATFNHDFNYPLARTSSNTLKLMVDERGLKYEFNAPNTTAGNDLLENVRNGNIKGSSFMFTVSEDTWTFKKGEDMDERTVIKVGKLFELGPVVMPAYPDTSAAARSAEAAKEEVKAEEKEEVQRTATKLKLTYTYLKNK